MLPSLNRTPGNSMVEYILPIAMVIILVGTFSMGGNFLDSFKTSLERQSRGHLANADLTVKQFGVIDDPSVVIPEIPEFPITQSQQTERVCFGDETTCLNIPVLSGTPDTTGGLGSDEIEALTSVLEQLPTLLEELGADPSMVDRVTKLANMGHGLGIKLKEIEGVCKRGKLCTGKESSAAKKELVALKKGELGEFMNQWKELEAVMKENPHALDAFPEAFGIIKSKVSEINTIISKLSAANSYRQVTQNSTRTVPAQCCGGCTWDCKKTIPTKVVVPVFQGLNFNSPGVKKVHQNANTICSNGGNRCYYNPQTG